MDNLHIKELGSASEFIQLEQAWQTLAAQDEQAGLFNDWQWNNLWWTHYGHLGELNVLLVYDNQQLVGIGPFYRTQTKALGLGKCDTLRFIGTGGNTSPDDLNILVLSSMRETVTDFICDHLFNAGSAGRLLFTDVNIDSAFYQSFTTRATKAAGYLVNPVMQSRRVANLPEEWAGFRKQISRNTHKQIKRRQNRLDAAGNASMQLCRSKEDINTAFDALVRLHVARWHTKGHSGSFGSDVYRQFHQSLMQQLDDHNHLWLATLQLDDEIIAVEYAFLYKDTLLFFQTGFDPEYEHLSPGHVLMTYAIKKAIESGVKHIDLLKGDYEYKTSYANQVRNSVSLGFYKSGLYSVLARLNDVRRKLKS